VHLVGDNAVLDWIRGFLLDDTEATANRDTAVTQSSRPGHGAPMPANTPP
jgi:hypothetical protein